LEKEKELPNNYTVSKGMGCLDDRQVPISRGTRGKAKSE
jgi:hypothetical protein